MRQSALAIVMLLGFSSLAQSPEAMSYRHLSYTGYGATDATRDRAVVDRFNALFSLLNTPAAPEVVPQEVTDMRAYLAKPHSGHAQELKAELYRKKLAQYEATHQANVASAALPTKNDVEAVVALVDTLPDGVTVKDETVSTTGDITLVGHFNIVMKWAEKEEDFLKRVKALAAAADGNIVIINYRRELGDAYRTSHGVAGVVIRQPAFDPTKLKLGKLPADL